MISDTIYKVCNLVLNNSVFFFQAEDGIRDLVRSRGLGDVYKRQIEAGEKFFLAGNSGAFEEFYGSTPFDQFTRNLSNLSLIHI